MTQQHITSKNLPNLVFKAELPEEYIKKLPAQTIYLCIKRNGLSSSCDLINLLNIEQCRILLDFDLWHKDEFVEDNFWNWLDLADEDNNFDIIEKIATSMDLRLVSALIQKYVHFVTFDDATELPPHAGYYTPDNGHTWIFIHAEDSHKHFLLGRFLALIFDRDGDLFYQLLAVATQATNSVLVEDAFLDAQKRLQAEGVPEREYAFNLHQAISDQEILRIYTSTTQVYDHFKDIPSIQPLIYDSSVCQPLADAMKFCKHPSEVESEFTLLMNAAIVHFSVEFYEYEKVYELAGKIKGALNIGLESACMLTNQSAEIVLEHLGLQKLYAHGFSKLMELRKKILSLGADLLEGLEQESLEFLLLAGIRLPFPECPECFRRCGEILKSSDGKLVTGFRAIEHLDEIKKLEEFLIKKQDAC